MKLNIQISRTTQILLLFTFFLPFFPRGCGDFGMKHTREKFIRDSLVMDSIKRAEADSILKIDPNANADSIVNAQFREFLRLDSVYAQKKTDSIQHADSITVKTDTVGSNVNTIKVIPTVSLSQKSKLFKTLLRPGDDAYTGVGFMMDTFLAYLFYCGTWTAFLLFAIGTILKHQNFTYIILIINIIAWLFLFFTCPNGNIDDVNFKFWTDKLWGYWVCVIFGLILIIYDSILLWRRSKNK